MQLYYIFCIIFANQQKRHFNRVQLLPKLFSFFITTKLFSTDLRSLTFTTTRGRTYLHISEKVYLPLVKKPPIQKCSNVKSSKTKIMGLKHRKNFNKAKLFKKS